MAASSGYSPLSYYTRLGLAGGLCASIPHAVLVPIDVVKTRMQLEGAQFRSMGEAFRAVVQSDGKRGLLLGLTPTLLGYFVQGMFKFGGFELCKNALRDTFGEERVIANPLLTYMVSSAIAETVGTTLLTPFESLRIRMVAAPTEYPSSIAGTRSILHTEGAMVGFYRGLAPLLLKQLPYTVTQLTVFSFAADAMYERVIPRLTGYQRSQLSTQVQLGVSIACGVMAGCTSSVVSHPADTILTRIFIASKKQAAARAAFNAGDLSMEAEANSKVSIASVYNKLGFRGLWAGVGTRCIMVGALSALMFLINDTTKVLVGLKTSSGLGKKKVD
jgi:solute carrier family 25 (mitochondrial phosphate transporter), member 3